MSAIDSLPSEAANPRPQRRKLTSALLAAAMAAIVLLSGCASTMAPHNAPFAGEIAARGYRVGASRPAGTPESLVFGLSFSGGGTRAAALAYGVLEELARTPVMVGGEQRRMLDLVETISAVSGGSYTAAYYGLFGERIFKDFEPRFLKRNVQNEMATTLFSPANLFNMSSPYYGRSDVTAEYLDEILFEGKTFSDLDAAVRQHGRPFVLINATDMARTSRFEFTQDQFDLLCSDIGSYKVSRAVTASSAIPVVFSPITLAQLRRTMRLQRAAVDDPGAARPPRLRTTLRHRLGPHHLSRRRQAQVRSSTRRRAIRQPRPARHARPADAPRPARTGRQLPAQEPAAAGAHRGQRAGQARISAARPVRRSADAQRHRLRRRQHHRALHRRDAGLRAQQHERGGGKRLPSNSATALSRTATTCRRC